MTASRHQGITLSWWPVVGAVSRFSTRVGLIGLLSPLGADGSRGVLWAECPAYGRANPRLAGQHRRPAGEPTSQAYAVDADVLDVLRRDHEGATLPPLEEAVEHRGCIDGRAFVSHERRMGFSTDD